MPPEPLPPRVTVCVQSGVADVRLNRPEKLNALDMAMFDALVDAGERLRGDPSIRAVVLSGEGRGFSAGLDVASLEAMAGVEGAASAVDRLGRRTQGGMTNHAQQAAFVWSELPAPVIAAVHGVALGGGLQIALAADLRIVAPDAQLSVLEIRWGLVPDMTGTHTLRRLLPLDVAKELTWTGRMVSGVEAVSMGLATRLSDEPLRDALALATDLASRSPQAIRGAKRLLNQSGLVSQRDQFQAESAVMASIIGSPNQLEAVAASLENRPPRFVDSADFP
jgi:enoyl-CoA hydratase/carnithine racemase